MDSFTIELVFNASAKIFPDNTLSSFTNFLPEQVNIEGQWQVAIAGITYPPIYQTVTVGKYMFFDTKLSNSSEFFYLEPGLYHSSTDFVEDMNTLIQERHNHTETSIGQTISKNVKC